MERCLTSSFEDRESALISRRNLVPGFFDITQSEQWKETREEVSASGTCGTIRKDLTSK